MQFVLKGVLLPGVEDDGEARLYIGGSEVANIKDSPFTVAIAVKKGDELRIICTGSIVSEEWVLTAAHCVFLSESLLWVAAGTNSRVDIDEAFHKSSEPFANGSVQIRNMISIVKHPRYKPLDQEMGQFVARFDVALCKVKSWSFGGNVNKIALWSKEWDGEKDASDLSGEEYSILECNSFGWGITSPTDIIASTYLRTSKFVIRHGNQGCSCFKPYMNRRMLCTGPHEKSHSACPGDSGGPLVCSGKLAGVAHIGYISGNCLFQPFSGRSWDYGFSHIPLSPAAQICGLKNLVSAWMYVCPVLGWIGEHVPDTPKSPLSCQSPPLPTLSLFIVAVPLIVTLASFV